MPDSQRGLTLPRRTQLPGSSFHLIPSTSRVAETTSTGFVPGAPCDRADYAHATVAPKRLRPARSTPCGMAIATSNRFEQHQRPSALFAAFRQPAWSGPCDCRYATILLSTQDANRTSGLQEETSRTKSLQLTGFQVHPWQHCNSGWRLSPHVANPRIERLGWWVATVCSRRANQPPHHRFRRVRPGWQRGWCRVGQPPSKHPPFRSPSVLGLPLSGLFGHLWDGCLDDRRLLLTSNAASSIPVRFVEARNASCPVSPTSGTRRPKAPYHRQVPSCTP
jgi:hypothetical protein